MKLKEQFLFRYGERRYSMKTSLLSTVLVLAVVIIVAIIAFIRVKKKGTCGCGKEDCECCSSKHKHDK